MYNNNSSSGEQLDDNIGGQRSKFDVMATILHIAIGPSLKNHIIGKGNFSDAMANHYLSILLYQNLLAASKDETGRTCYRTTEKGLQFLRYYREIQNLFARGQIGSGMEEAMQARASAVINEKITTATPSSDNPVKRILIVDDEDDISSAMQIGLENSGFKVDTYNDPMAALANYKPHVYDLLLFDVKMPRMSGFELYRKIREVDVKTRVCFLTAFEMYSEEFKKVFPSMDVRHFIQKPIAMPDLIEQIQRLTEAA